MTPHLSNTSVRVVGDYNEGRDPRAVETLVPVVASPLDQLMPMTHTRTM